MSSTIWNIHVDTGGTFTDCIAQAPDGGIQYIKVLSDSTLRGTIEKQISAQKFHIHQQWHAPDDFVAGLMLKPLGQPDTAVQIQHFDAKKSAITLENTLDDVDWQGVTFEIGYPEEAPVLACRLATRTPRGELLPPIRLRLATTKGTNALLERKGASTLLLVTEGFRDFLRIGNQQRERLFDFEVQKRSPIFERVIEIPERIDAEGNVLKRLQNDQLPDKILSLTRKHNMAVAVCLMNSHANPKHENKLADWLRAHGVEYISCSSDMSSLIKLLPRSQTAVVNAFLEPVLRSYIDGVEEILSENKLFLMNSAAGLVSSDHFKPKDSLLSGPAGGVTGAATVGKELGHKKIISLDMGGTSTDVSRYDQGFDYQFTQTVGDATIKAPALSIETVAAGRGSICSFDGQKLTVGPESAGAHPGPACYGAGGPLTLTDINVLSGRLQPQNFNIPISKNAAEQKLAKLRQKMEQAGQSASCHEVLDGFLQIANERMADAINTISLRKGYDPSEYALATFGGAGAQHATAIADMLDISTVLVPSRAGLLSAYGLAHASFSTFAEQQILQPLHKIEADISSISSQLEKQAAQKLRHQFNAEAPHEVMVERRMLFMRLEGQESTLEINFDADSSYQDAFIKAYKNRYGHWIEGRNIEVASMRVAVASQEHAELEQRQDAGRRQPEPLHSADIQFGDKPFDTPVFKRSHLSPEQTMNGPAIILDPHSTTVVEPHWKAEVAQNGTLQLLNVETRETSSEYTESVDLELFTHRFTSIAKEMGEMMQRTALSVNVKERLDFSCALLNAEGELIVNAPHIPVHLGALGICVRKISNQYAMQPGDVMITNHPYYGGSHLPDITVVTPIFAGKEALLGYAACRAHHAEIGGTRPGSMPPDATSLAEEGVIIPPTYLMKEGEMQWKKVKSILKDAPHPSRSVEENIADLKAALAANHQGAKALHKLAQKEGTQTIRHYMSELKKQAARKTRRMIQLLPDLSAECEEFLDDGTRLCASIDKSDGTLHIDFSGTDDVHPHNLNATPAIVYSVVMYVLRCLIEAELPLNEGMLEPVEVELPLCLLNPDFTQPPEECPAVVGGNTEVSQRLVDLLLKPFEKVACSQGTMNNVLFGNETFGYYETIGGGTGAGPDFDGADAVHHHMTNTAGTDPEILEHRYPVRLERYEIRQCSGGEGKYEGGQGIIRELTFLESVSLSVLTQHRVETPYGLQGGNPGQTGEQYVMRKDGTKIQLGPVDGLELEAGDRFIIKTPGGGGFGSE